MRSGCLRRPPDTRAFLRHKGADSRQGAPETLTEETVTLASIGDHSSGAGRSGEDAITQEACVFVLQSAVAPSWLVPLGAAFLGAVLAFLSRGVYDRWVNGATTRRLALALFEELSAVEFAPGPPAPHFAGFSSQVFDSLFAELSRYFPEGLFRAVVRYHWKMKFIEEQVRAQRRTLGSAAGALAWTGVTLPVAQAEGQWKSLLPRLDAHSTRWLLRLFVTREERLRHVLPSLRPRE